MLGCSGMQICPESKTSIRDILRILTYSETDKTPGSFLLRQLTCVRGVLKLLAGLHISRNTRTFITNP